MGQGTRQARQHPRGGKLHADVMDELKDQLLIVLMKRLQDKDGRVTVSIPEMDDTGNDLLALQVLDMGTPSARFEFKLEKKRG